MSRLLFKGKINKGVLKNLSIDVFLNFIKAFFFLEDNFIILLNILIQNLNSNFIKFLTKIQSCKCNSFNLTVMEKTFNCDRGVRLDNRRIFLYTKFLKQFLELIFCLRKSSFNIVRNKLFSMEFDLYIVQLLYKS